MKLLIIAALLFVGCGENEVKQPEITFAEDTLPILTRARAIVHDTIYIHDTIYRNKVTNFGSVENVHIGSVDKLIQE